MPPVVGHAKAGKLRVIAVTGERRSAAMPEIPTVDELPGFGEFRFTNWMGVFVPARTPVPIVQRLADTLATIVKEPETRERLIAAGVDPAGSSSAEFVTFLHGETQRYGRLSKERGIKATSE